MTPTEKLECAVYRILLKKDQRREQVYRAACHGGPSWEHKGQSYCLMHAPTIDKAADFGKVLQEKLNARDYNFFGAWFPEDVDFSGRNFETAVDFSFATFNGIADFSKTRFDGRYAEFIEVQFSGDADFTNAQFNAGIADFTQTKFIGKTHFDKTRFCAGDSRFTQAQFSGEQVSFGSAQFDKGDTYFDSAQFAGSRTDFNSTEFNGGKADFKSARFSGGKTLFFEAQFSGGDADFSTTLFSGGDADFHKAEFSGGKADFNKAEFSGGKADFKNAEFSGGDASFIEVQFSGGIASFKNAKFASGRVDFYKADFSAGKADFNKAQFSHGDISFIEAKFSGEADFSEVKVIGDGGLYFRKAQFSEDAHFEEALFSGQSVVFGRAEFSKTAFFRKATFEEKIDFGCTIFKSQVFFDDATFKPTAFLDFRLARFMDFIRFTRLEIEDGAEFYFGEAIFDKPNLVYFSDLSDLQLRWFMNTDTRLFIYENVEFPAFKKPNPMPEELKGAQQLLLRINEIDKREGKEVDLPYRLLVTVLRRMADNAEANSRYQYASSDRYMAFEVERLERIENRRIWFSEVEDILKREIACKPFWPGIIESFQKLRNRATFYPSGVPQFLYRTLSSYGESWLRATIIMFSIWAVFALLYLSPMASFYRWETKVSGSEEYQKALDENKIDKEGRRLNPGEAFTYSFAVMALQKPEPKPLGPLTNSLVLFETVFAPVQLALLALAIRRKFMR